MSKAPLSVILTVPSDPQKVGVVVPVKIEVRNVSSDPVWMIGVLDGSEQGYRFPQYQPSITSEPPVPPPEMEECGNLAPLRLQEFTHLDPNESFDPTVSDSGAAYLPIYTFANFVAPAPGSYQFRLKLSTRSDNEDDWLGMRGYPGESDVLARLKDVPRVEVESNVATLVVVP